MEYLFSKTYKDIDKIRETIKNDFLLHCNDKERLCRFIWDISPLVDKIKSKYFRMLNKDKPIWELDYRLKNDRI